MYRIWIDQDNTIYDLHDPWLKQHNRDFPNHNLKIEDHTGWDAVKACRDNNCAANIYGYFNNPETWTDGQVIDNSQDITRLWKEYLGVELGICTTAANDMSIPLKKEWLREYFPHIKDIVIVNGHLKHVLRGDIIIDDAIHNVEHFQGIRILYTMPWNKQSTILRAHNWNEVDYLVRKAIKLLDQELTHTHIQSILEAEQRIGL